MFTLAVKDFVMIAHSLRGEAFGPAQRMHGATLGITAELKVAALSDIDVVVDIGVFRSDLRGVLDGLDYRNLDEHAAFPGRRSTTERIAEYIGKELARALLARGVPSGSLLRVQADESPVAWVAHESTL